MGMVEEEEEVAVQEVSRMRWRWNLSGGPGSDY